MTDPKARTPTDSEERVRCEVCEREKAKSREGSGVPGTPIGSLCFTGVPPGTMDFSCLAKGYERKTTALAKAEAALASARDGAFEKMISVELPRLAEPFAKYHEEHARHGGASQEFHERAASFLRALGEARGTASASESLDKTQNSEQGALRASLDGTAGHTPGPWEVETGRDGAFEIHARMPDSGLFNVVCARGTWTSPERQQTSIANANLIAAAPDLLRENARLRGEGTAAQCAANEALAEVRRLRGELVEARYTGWWCAFCKMQLSGDRASHDEMHAAELTRARAAHMENAELLAKANAHAESMQRAAESSSRHYAEAIAAKGRVESVIRDALRALREVQESGDVDPEEVGGEINRVEHMLLGCLPAGETWPIPAAEPTSDDRKGNAAQPPLVRCTPMRCRIGLDFHHCEAAGHLAAPAKEGKKP